MGKTLMYIHGTDGQVELMSDRVVIHRNGLLNMFRHGFHSKREIPLSAITSVNFFEAGFFRLGFIDFDFAGRSQLDRRQNAVKFGMKGQKDFLALKEKVFEMINQAKKG